MADNLLKKDLSTNILPGYFTNNYVSRGNYSTLPQLAKLASVAESFANELQEAYLKNPSLVKARFANPKVQNVPNCLPLTGSIVQRVGTQGMVMFWGVMRLCQYYKKASAPRFM